MDGLHENWEFENRVNRLRNMVEEVVRLLAEVPEMMLTISSRPMSLAPSSSSPVPSLPGGPGLVLLGPESEFATETDDTPHPATVFRRLADEVREAQGRPAVRGEAMWSSVPFLVEHMRWIVASPGVDHFEQEVSRARHHLRVLLGDVEPPSLPSTEEVVSLMRERVEAAPSSFSMTPAEADHVWPGIHDRIRKAKQRRTWGHEPDARGRYSCEVLLEYARDRRTGHPRERGASHLLDRMSH